MVTASFLTASSICIYKTEIDSLSNLVSYADP